MKRRAKSLGDFAVFRFDMPRFPPLAKAVLPPAQGCHLGFRFTALRRPSACCLSEASVTGSLSRVVSAEEEPRMRLRWCDWSTTTSAGCRLQLDGMRAARRQSCCEHSHEAPVAVRWSWRTYAGGSRQSRTRLHPAPRGACHHLLASTVTRTSRSWPDASGIPPR